MLAITLSDEIFELTHIDGKVLSFLDFYQSDETGYMFIYDYGETSFHVFCEDGLYKFGRSSRYGKVFVEAVSPDQANIERILIRILGEDYRKSARLPAIRVPTAYPYTEKDIREGFTVIYLSEEEWVLQRPDGSRVDATFIGGQRDWPEKARYSYIMDVPVVDLVASYLDPDGYPALHEFVL